MGALLYRVECYSILWFWTETKFYMLYWKNQNQKTKSHNVISWWFYRTCTVNLLLRSGRKRWECVAHCYGRQTDVVFKPELFLCKNLVADKFLVRQEATTVSSISTYYVRSTVCPIDSYSLSLKVTNPVRTYSRDTQPMYSSRVWAYRATAWRGVQGVSIVTTAVHGGECWRGGWLFGFRWSAFNVE